METARGIQQSTCVAAASGPADGRSPRPRQRQDIAAGSSRIPEPHLTMRVPAKLPLSQRPGLWPGGLRAPAWLVWEASLQPAASPHGAIVTASSRLCNETHSRESSAGPRPARPAPSELRPVCQPSTSAQRALTPASPQPAALQPVQMPACRARAPAPSPPPRRAPAPPGPTSANRCRTRICHFQQSNYRSQGFCLRPSLL